MFTSKAFYKIWFKLKKKLFFVNPGFFYPTCKSGCIFFSEVSAWSLQTYLCLCISMQPKIYYWRWDSYALQTHTLLVVRFNVASGVHFRAAKGGIYDLGCNLVTNLACDVSLLFSIALPCDRFDKCSPLCLLPCNAMALKRTLWLITWQCLDTAIGQ